MISLNLFQPFAPHLRQRFDQNFDGSQQLRIVHRARVNRQTFEFAQRQCLQRALSRRILCATTPVHRAIAASPARRGATIRAKQRATRARIGRTALLFGALMSLGWVFHNSERHAQVQAAFGENIARSRQLQRPTIEAVNLVMLGFSMLLEGRHDAAYELGQQSGHVPLTKVMSRAMFAIVARERGALEVARDFASRGERVLSHRHALGSGVRDQRLRGGSPSTRAKTSGAPNCSAPPTRWAIRSSPA